MPYTMIVNIVVFAFNYIPCSTIEAFLMPQMAIVNIVVSQIRKVCVRVHVQQAYSHGVRPDEKNARLVDPQATDVCDLDTPGSYRSIMYANSSIGRYAVWRT